MFKELQPLLAEGRKIHIVLAGAKTEGNLVAYIEPAQKNDKEPDAFLVPFKVEDTAEALDTGLGAILTEWLTARTAATTSLTAALAEVTRLTAEKVEADKKKAEEAKAKIGAKKPAATPAAAKSATGVVAPTPTLKGAAGASTDAAPAAPAVPVAPAPATATVVQESLAVDLF